MLCERIAAAAAQEEEQQLHAAAWRKIPGQCCAACVCAIFFGVVVGV